MLRYEIRAMDLRAHEFVLRLRVPDPLPRGQCLSLPAWIPGSYMIRDFARHVTSIFAHDEQGPVALEKLDKQTWRAATCHGGLVIDYRVYAFDLSVRGAYLDRTRGYFNGPCVFLSVSDRPDLAWELSIGPPGDDALGEWRVATALPTRDTDARGFGLYAGQGYEQLIDCPVEMGEFSEAEFSVGEIRHRFVVSDGGRFDLEKICRDMGPICREHASMFGDLPVREYLFMTLATADGYGGLEHRESTSLVCKRTDLPAPGSTGIDRGYRRYLALCSHEYFHLWNVKRIRPERLTKCGLDSEVHTELLWAFEGITSYYDELALVRCGVLAVDDYLDLFANTATRLLRNPGRSRQSIAASSFDAWTKFYKQDENAPNAIVSYYTKGALVAFGLDVSVRERSGDTLSLDDLMRQLWQRYGKTGRGIPERGIEGELQELLGSPMEDFFTRYVYGTEELPLEDWFSRVGIGFGLRPAKSDDDLGGLPSEERPAQPTSALGARFQAGSEGLRLTNVLAGGAAQVAGLAPGDLLVALDGERLTASNLSSLMQRLNGEYAELHYFRRDRLAVTRLPSYAPSADTCELWQLPDDSLESAVLARRAAWLRSNRIDSA